MKAILTKLIIILFLIPYASIAVNLSCEGPIIEVLVHKGSGGVAIKSDWNAGFPVLCYTRYVRDDVAPETCAVWVGLLESAKAQDKNIRIYYTELPEGSTCESIPGGFSAPGPAYISSS